MSPYFDVPWDFADSWLVTGDILYPQKIPGWNNPWLLTSYITNSMAHLSMVTSPPSRSRHRRWQWSNSAGTTPGLRDTTVDRSSQVWWNFTKGFFMGIHGISWGFKWLTWDFSWEFNEMVQGFNGDLNGGFLLGFNEMLNDLYNMVSWFNCYLMGISWNLYGNGISRDLLISMGFHGISWRQPTSKTWKLPSREMELSRCENHGRQKMGLDPLWSTWKTTSSWDLPVMFVGL